MLLVLHDCRAGIPIDNRSWVDIDLSGPAEVVVTDQPEDRIVTSGELDFYSELVHCWTDGGERERLGKPQPDPRRLEGRERHCLLLPCEHDGLHGEPLGQVALTHQSDERREALRRHGSEQDVNSGDAGGLRVEALREGAADVPRVRCEGDTRLVGTDRTLS